VPPVTGVPRRLFSPPRWAEQDQQSHRRDPANHLAPVSGSHDWTAHEVTAQIPDDGARIALGIFQTGRGRIELRNAELTRNPVVRTP
jgi:hypothetical protein